MNQILVHYPGHHGPEALVSFGRSPRGMRFAAGQVRPMDAREARSLIQTGGYHEALDLKAGAERFGLTQKAVKALDGLTIAEHLSDGQDKAETVYVLDVTTARRLRIASVKKNEPAEETTDE